MDRLIEIQMDEAKEQLITLRHLLQSVNASRLPDEGQRIRERIRYWERKLQSLQRHSG